jgi:hypothetical protein
MHPASSCLNCGAALGRGVNYCPACGQRAQVHRLNAAHLSHEVVHFVTHADKGIFYLVRMLATRPGLVVREYIAGRRKRYFSPLNFFLIVIGLFVFVQTTFRPMGTVNMEAHRQEIMKIPDQTVRERRLVKLERAEAASTFMARYSNYINMAVTPVVSFVFFLLFYKRGYNYTEHLVANMYFAGFNALVYVFIIAPYMVLMRDKPVSLLGVLVFLLWEAFYRAWGYYTFLNKRTWGQLAYISLVSLLVVAGWAFFSRAMITRYIDHGF